jgi:hypothetical protein
MIKSALCLKSYRNHYQTRDSPVGALGPVTPAPVGALGPAGAPVVPGLFGAPGTFVPGPFGYYTHAPATLSATAAPFVPAVRPSNTIPSDSVITPTTMPTIPTVSEIKTESETATPVSGTGWSVRGKGGFSVGSASKSKSVTQKGRKYRCIYKWIYVYIHIYIYIYIYVCKLQCKFIYLEVYIHICKHLF